MTKFFDSICRVLPPLALAIAIFFLTVFEASSEPAESPGENFCETVWRDIVLNIEVLIGQSNQTEKVVLFAGQDGHIFNCLNQPFPDHALQELQYWSKIRSRVIVSDPFNDNSIPPNYCNFGYGSNQGIQNMTIHLPYDRKELASQSCTVRLRGVSKSVQRFLNVEPESQ